jgi:hypothetical protein
VVGVTILLLTLLAWSASLYDRIAPISGLTPEEMQSFTPEQFNLLLGQDGIMITALIFFAGIAIVFSVLYAFKAFFYRDYAGEEQPEPDLQQGEYDSKGRWYKY